MLSVYEKIIFVVLAALAAWYAYVGFARLVKVVQRGQVGDLPRTDKLSTRLVTGIIKTMSQRTVFRDRPVASFFHSLIFYGFVLYLAVNVVDGLNGSTVPRRWPNPCSRARAGRRTRNTDARRPRRRWWRCRPQ